MKINIIKLKKNIIIIKNIGKKKKISNIISNSFICKPWILLMQIPYMATKLPAMIH